MKSQNIKSKDAYKNVRVGITYNLKKNIIKDPPDFEAEFDDFDTILAIKNALESSGYTVILYEVSDDLPLRLMTKRPDIVFNIAEGSNGYGREAHIPAILNFLSIPFSGSDETTMCFAMNKDKAKRLALSHGIKTPSWKLFNSIESFSTENLNFPAIVKPNAEGSSKGITGKSVVNSSWELRETLNEKFKVYRQEMLVEEYIQGREFTVGILGNGNEKHVYSPMEIVFKSREHSIYSYDVKRNFKSFIEYTCEPDIDKDVLTKLKNNAGMLYDAFGCFDFARIDFRVSENNDIYFIEINPLAGLAPGYSDFPMLAEFCGTDYNSLICSILDSAIKRYGISFGVSDER